MTNDNVKTYEMMYCPACEKLVPKHRQACCWCGIDIQQAETYFKKYHPSYSGIQYKIFNISDVPEYVKQTDYSGGGEVDYVHFSKYLIIIIPLCLLFVITQGGIFVIIGIILFTVFGLSKEKEYNHYYINGDNNKRDLIEQVLEQDAKYGDQNDEKVLLSRKRRQITNIILPLNHRMLNWHFTFSQYSNDWQKKWNFYGIPSIADMVILNVDPLTGEKMMFDYKTRTKHPLTETDFIQLQKDRIIVKKIKAKITEKEWYFLSHGTPFCIESQVTMPTIRTIPNINSPYSLAEQKEPQLEIKSFSVFMETGSFNEIDKLFDIEWGDEII